MEGDGRIQVIQVTDLYFHSHGGTQKYLVYFRENPKQKWMMTRGTPISGNPHIYIACIACFCLVTDGLEVDEWCWSLSSQWETGLSSGCGCTMVT